MLTDRQQFIILDAINEPFIDVVLTSNHSSNGASPLVVTIVTLQTILNTLPAVRLDMLTEIATDLQSADQSMRQYAIAGKGRLIQADVLKWSDHPSTSQEATIARLKCELAVKIRTILGLESIALLMAKYGISTSTSTELRRS